MVTHHLCPASPCIGTVSDPHVEPNTVTTVTAVFLMKAQLCVCEPSSHWRGLEGGEWLVWSQKVQRPKLLGGTIAANLEVTLGEQSLHTSYREYGEDKYGGEVAGS